jgi:hypothetical protein
MTTLFTDPLGVGIVTSSTELTAYSAAQHTTSQWAYSKGNNVLVTATGAASGGAYDYTSGPVAYVSSVTFGADQWASINMPATLPPSATSGLAVILRAITGGTWLAAEFRFNSSVWLWGSNAGATPAPITTQTNWGPMSPTWVAGETLQFQIQGTAIAWIRYGANAGTFTGTLNTLGNTIEAATRTGSAPGIGAFQGTSGSGFPGTVTAFQAGNFLTGPVAPTSAKGVYNVRTTSQP